MQYVPNPPNPQHIARLAPHETLELHELLASKSIELFHLKKSVAKVFDPELKQLFFNAIRTAERQITELINLLQYRPMIS